jgi:hypothetical protein
MLQSTLYHNWPRCSRVPWTITVSNLKLCQSMIDILFVWYICSLRDQVVGMEVIVGPQDGPSQKLIDELEVRYICLPELGVQWSRSYMWFMSSVNWTWQLRPAGMWCCDLGWRVPDVLKEHSAFTFSVRQFLQEGTAVLQNVRERSHKNIVSHHRKSETSAAPLSQSPVSHM